MKKLSDAELNIMKILWSHGDPMTSNQILEEYKEYADWKLASLMTALARMVDKEYVYCDRSTRTNYYSALISEEQYKLEEGNKFIDNLFNRSAVKLIACLYQGNKMSDEEITELRTYLDSLEKNKEEGDTK